MSLDDDLNDLLNHSFWTEDGYPIEKNRGPVPLPHDQYGVRQEINLELARQFPRMDAIMRHQTAEVARLVVEPFIERAMLFGDPSLLPALVGSKPRSPDGRPPHKSGTVFTAVLHSKFDPDGVRRRFMTLPSDGAGSSPTAIQYDCDSVPSGRMPHEVYEDGQIIFETVQIELDPL